MPLSVRYSRTKTLLLSAASVLTIVVLEWQFGLDYSLGIFYIFPMVIAAGALNRPETVLAALACAWIRSYFTPNLSWVEYGLRFAMATLAYGGVGLLVGEMSRNRRVLLSAYTRIQIEQSMRRQAEDQLRILVELSPAAILTLDHEGTVLAANQSAHTMLGVSSPQLISSLIGEHVPVLSGALRAKHGELPVRAAATSWARRADGTQFPIATWFSTYGEGNERRLAAIFVDESEEVRDRERQAFEQLAEHDRLLASAVSHEIRNMTLAIRVVTLNLGRKHELAADEDFGALTTMVASLSQMASFELRRGANGVVPITPLHKVLDQLRIVIEPDWNEVDGTVHWNIESPGTRVRADEHALLQVLLNLSQNALRATQSVEGERRLEIEQVLAGDSVVIRVIDNGPGVANPTKLFRAFQEGSDGSGLGLYIARTMVRSLDGDLIHVPQATGCRFDVRLPIADAKVRSYEEKHA